MDRMVSRRRRPAVLGAAFPGRPGARAAMEAIAERERCIVHYTNKAVCQAVLLPVPETEITEVSYEELKAMTSERMEGKLGSSGR